MCSKKSQLWEEKSQMQDNSIKAQSPVKLQLWEKSLIVRYEVAIMRNKFTTVRYEGTMCGIKTQLQ